MKENLTLGPELLCDTRLIELSLAGGREAFGQIVARYQSPICALAYSACGNVARNEDLAQEIFITAWRKLDSLEEPSRSWKRLMFARAALDLLLAWISLVRHSLLFLILILILLLIIFAAKFHGCDRRSTIPFRPSIHFFKPAAGVTLPV